MKSSLQITFRGMKPSDALEAEIRRRAERLEKHCDRITSILVTVEAPVGNQRQGEIYRVSLEVRVPGTELYANRAPGDNPAHEDVYVALRDAFRAARRELESWRDKNSGPGRRHADNRATA